MSHANAPLTAEGRRRLCQRVDAGRPRAHVAAEAGVSRQCLSKWHARWRDRKLGPAQIAYELGRAGTVISPAGVHRVLLRLGISRLRDLDRPTGQPLRATRYERQRPGELVHIDVKKLGKIPAGGGWWAHGHGSGQDVANRKAAAGRVGYDYVHAAVDGHTRLSYVEVLPDEKGTTCAGFITRAGSFFGGYGTTIERVLSDNAFAYRKSHDFRAAVTALGAQQRFIKPNCPWTNGKAERFNQTLASEWAYAATYLSSQQRVDALPELAPRL